MTSERTKFPSKNIFDMNLVSEEARYEFRYVTCNICNSNKTVYLGIRLPLIWEKVKSEAGKNRELIKIVKCKHCGLIYPNPMPIPNIKQLQKNYSNPEEYFPSQSNEKRLKYKNIVNSINHMAKKKGRFLDVGCGRGELVYIASMDGWLAEGIDTSISFVNYAKERFGINVKVGTLEEMNFPDESFDVVCLCSVLQHVLDPFRLMTEINRILKKKGILYMENINNESFIYKAGDLFYKLIGEKKSTCLSPTFPSYQIYGFSPRSIKEICSRTNFKILKIRLKGIKGGGSLSIKSSLKGIGLELARRFAILMGGLLGHGHVLEAYVQKSN